MFTLDSLLLSDWYRQRLQMKQERDVALWKRHIDSLECFGTSGIPPGNLDIEARFKIAKEQLARVSSPGYLEDLKGTIGADPFTRQT